MIPQTRYDVRLVINILGLAVHSGLALLAFILFLALALSGKAHAVIAGSIVVILILPLIPVVRRVVINRSVAVAVTQQSMGLRSSVATGAAAAGLITLIILGTNSNDDLNAIGRESAMIQWAAAFALVYLSTALREFPRPS